MKATVWAAIVVAILAAGCTAPMREDAADVGDWMLGNASITPDEATGGGPVVDWLLVDDTPFPPYAAADGGSRAPRKLTTRAVARNKMPGDGERRMDIIIRVLPAGKEAPEDTPAGALRVEVGCLRTEFADWHEVRCSRRTLFWPVLYVVPGKERSVKVTTEYSPRKVRIVETAPGKYVAGSTVLLGLFMNLKVAKFDAAKGAGTLTISVAAQDDGYADVYVPATNVPFALGETRVITQTAGPIAGMLSEPTRDAAAEKYWGDGEHVRNFKKVTTRLPHEVAPKTLIEPLEIGAFTFQSEKPAGD